MTVRVVTTNKPIHICDLPKWKTRRRMKVRLGTIVECHDCKQRWQWRPRGALDISADWLPVE